MTGLLIALDVLIAAAALTSACFWWLASQHRVRRISRHETLDATDINRLVISLNRTPILNSRAALATACAGLLAAGGVGLGSLTSL